MDLRKNPELLPLVEWWEKDGKQTVIYLLVAAIAVGGWYGWKYQKAAKKAAAADALAMAYTTAELEEAVARFGESATGGALKLRLAKSYYNDERFEDALGQYEGLIGKAPDGFADIPVVGKAQCLEALGKFDEAAATYDAFAAANTNSYLKLTAQLGAARAICQAGDKKKALARIDALKAAMKDDSMAKSRVDETETLIKRFEKKTVPAPDAVAKPEAKPEAKDGGRPAETNKVDAAKK